MNLVLYRIHLYWDRFFFRSYLYCVGFCTEVVLNHVLYRDLYCIWFCTKVVLRQISPEVCCILSCSCRSYFHSFSFGTEVTCFEWGFCRKYWHRLRFLYKSYFYWVRFLYRRYVYWVTFCTECICVESCLHILFFYQSILWNPHTSDILSYFILVKSQVFRSPASLALSGTVMEQ